MIYHSNSFLFGRGSDIVVPDFRAYIFVQLITREILMKKLFPALLLLASTALTFGVSTAQAGERFWVVNRTDSNIDHVYALRGENFSRDMLGANGMIVSGDKVYVLRSGWRGCRHNILVTTDDGGEAYFTNFDTCRGPLYVHNKGLTYGD